jgi:hypothetical protein
MSMTAPPAFTRASAATQLFTLDTTATGLAPATYAAAFLPFQPPSAATLRLDLPASWTATPGWYLFLGGMPTDEATFLRAFQQVFGFAALQDARFIWLENPNDPPQGWRYAAIAIAGETPAVSRPARIGLRNYGLALPAGATVGPGAGGATLMFSAGAYGFSFLAQDGGATLDGVGGTITVPFAGAQIGCFVFALALHHAQGEVAPDLDRLDIGCRFFAAEATFPGSGLLTSWRYPIFNVAAPTLPLNASLDPLNPLASTRTYFAFTGTGTPLASYFRTTLGYPVTLTPQDNARLVAATRPVTTTAAPGDPLYLIPQGDFALGVVRGVGATAQPDQVMCGLSGVEYVTLLDGATNLLRFTPGQAAYAPGFVPGQPATPNATGQALTAAATTAWASIVTATGTPTYYAQPDQATLYTPQPPPGQANPDDTCLFYQEVPAAQLPGTAAFPLAPYAGLPGDALPIYQQYEAQVLSPARRALIHTAAGNLLHTALTASAPDPCALATDDVFRTTPQGLLARFAASGAPPAWKQLLLALDATGHQASFDCLLDGTPLRAAVQTNQLFLVISDPTALQGHFSASSLTIAEWSFALDLASWSQHGTILILKFHDKPLRDLVQDPSTWTQAQAFNTAPSDSSQQLAAMIQAALDTYQATDASAETKRDYQYFVESVVLDPHWHGIVALQVAVPPGALPPELAGLAAGIDSTHFYAHHLGVAVTPIDHTGGQLQVKPSSLFGLIDYRNAVYPPANDTGYNFKVDNLRVLFDNSQLASFSSQIEITLDQLFGEATALVNSPSGRNNIVLNGRYEIHDNQPAYVFGFSGDNVFALPDSHILNAVEIVKAQFTTTVPPGGFQAGAQVYSRFSFWGQFNFAKLDRFDLFSFGMAGASNGNSGDGDGQYLRFTNLGVTMTFLWGTADAATFAFDPGAVAFDPARSTPRANSLYAHFPLKIVDLLSSAGDKAPADLGYLPVQSPLVSPGLGKAWYGLVHELELGSAGALAGGVGLTVNLLAAWSPNPDGVSAFVGLKLPGSGSKSEFSLQGVLKLSFGGIQFITTGTEATGLGYILKLKNIVLKLLLLSFPPNGQTEVLIFGDPQAQSSNRTLGWYAAYAKKETPPPKPQPPPALPPGEPQA